MDTNLTPKISASTREGLMTAAKGALNLPEELKQRLEFDLAAECYPRRICLEPEVRALAAICLLLLEERSSGQSGL